MSTTAQLDTDVNDTPTECALAVRQRDNAKIEIDQLKNELRDYAVLALYEHAHITESEACRLTRLDPVSFRLLRENAFKTMCRLHSLTETPAPLPQP